MTTQNTASRRVADDDIPVMSRDSLTADPPSHRRHGTRVKYVVEGCRCEPCREAVRKAEARRNRLKAYGQWQPYIDAEPTRQHVRALMAAGMGWKRVATTAGLSCSTVWKLLYGDPARNREPNKRTRPATAERLLAVELALAGGVHMPAEPTWRRVRGLMALGYSKAWIARQIGNGDRALQLSEGKVRKAHADAVEALADRCAGKPGPSSRARNYAAARGWTPELLFDLEDDPVDDEIVDEVVIERALAGDRVDLTSAERAEVVRRLEAQGMGAGAIAHRLGTSTDTVRRYMTRAAASDQEAASA